MMLGVHIALALRRSVARALLKYTSGWKLSIALRPTRCLRYGYDAHKELSNLVRPITKCCSRIVLASSKSFLVKFDSCLLPCVSFRKTRYAVRVIGAM